MNTKRLLIMLLVIGTCTRPTRTLSVLHNLGNVGELWHL